MALDEVLTALELNGGWDSVAHVYRIKTAHGTAVVSPGSMFLKLGENFQPINHQPRFIDGKLRVSEEFVTQQLAPLLGEQIYYRNLDPPSKLAEPSQGTLDQLFAFLLRKKQPLEGRRSWALAIDPGHGGEDPGALGLAGSKEKDVVLAVSSQLERLVKMRQEGLVRMTRDGDYGLDLTSRLELAAAAKVDVLLSLHAQAAVSPGPRGIALFVRPDADIAGAERALGKSESLLLAMELSHSLQDAGYSVLGIYQAPVLPLGRGDLPRVLVEIGYLTNSDDHTALQDPASHKSLAKTLFSGLRAFADQQEVRSNAK